MNRFFISAIATAAVSATLALMGCSATSPTATVTVTNTVTTSAPTHDPVAQKAIDPNVEKSLRLQWGKDPNRLALFKDYGKAGLLIARALTDGKFGKVIKYNKLKTELQPGQTGWGSITVNTGDGTDPNKPGAFASVYYRADGTIDWSKGVPEFSIDMGPTYIGLAHFYKPPNGEKGVAHSLYLDVSPSRVDEVYATCFEYCGTDDERYHSTQKHMKLIKVETDAMKALDANMAALLGAGWRSLSS